MTVEYKCDKCGKTINVFMEAMEVRHLANQHQPFHLCNECARMVIAYLDGRANIEYKEEFLKDANEFIKNQQKYGL